MGLDRDLAGVREAILAPFEGAELPRRVLDALEATVAGRDPDPIETDAQELAWSACAVHDRVLELWELGRLALTPADVRALGRAAQAVLGQGLRAGATAAVRSARDAEATRQRERELMLGVIGHDLRTPLTAIKTTAEMLLRRGALTPPQTRSVTRIAASSERMTRLIGQLLDLARLRAGVAMPLSRAAVDLGELCQDVIAETHASQPDQQVVLQCDAAVVGTWDKDRLGQLVQNLVTNALQHGDGEEPVVVRVAGEHGDGVLEVHNGGPPIAPELVPTIFDPFRSASPRRAGSGLGLYIADQIVRAHDGRISVTSSEGDGTTFRVELPLAPVAEVAATP